MGRWEVKGVEGGGGVDCGWRRYVLNRYDTNRLVHFLNVAIIANSSVVPRDAGWKILKIQAKGTSCPFNCCLKEPAPHLGKDI